MSTWFSDVHMVSAGTQSALFMIKGYTPRLQFERFDDGNGIIGAPVRPSQCQEKRIALSVSNAGAYNQTLGANKARAL
jgi:hypothetical protein